MSELKNAVEIDLKVRLPFSSLPEGVQIVDVSVNWDGEPLILCDEGKPPQPSRKDGMEAQLAWLATAPAAFRVYFVKNGKMEELRWRNQYGATFLQSVQRLGNHWLTALGAVLDDDGNLVRSLDIDFKVASVQTTSDEKIWVSYFDEGVFSDQGIAPSGLACFDSSGKVIFRFDELAEARNLPFIADCYTLNVAEGDVWLSYYTDFPLVQLRDFDVKRVWNDFGANRAVAVRKSGFLTFPAYGKPYLTWRTFDSATESVLNLRGIGGKPLSTPPAPGDHGFRVPFYCKGRGPRMYVVGPDAVYEVPEIPEIQ